LVARLIRSGGLAIAGGLFAVGALVLHRCRACVLPGDDELHDLRSAITDLKAKYVANALLKWKIYAVAGMAMGEQALCPPLSG
jgi:hypothetical protein